MAPDTILYGFHASDLFPHGDHGYNEYESAKLYATLVEAALQREYPDADVTVAYDLGSGGVLPYHLQTKVDYETHHPDVPMVNEIAGRVYETYKWMV